MLQVFVLLGHLVAQLVVDLAPLVIDDVRVLLVEEDSGLAGGQEGHRGLGALLAGDNDHLLLSIGSRCSV